MIRRLIRRALCWLHDAQYDAIVARDAERVNDIEREDTAPFRTETGREFEADLSIGPAPIAAGRTKSIHFYSERAPTVADAKRVDARLRARRTGKTSRLN